MVKPRAARTGAGLCTEEMRRGGDSTGNPRKQSGRRRVQLARVGEQTRVVIFSEAAHFQWLPLPLLLLLLGVAVRQATRWKLVRVQWKYRACSAEGDGWELQCFADC